MQHRHQETTNASHISRLSNTISDFYCDKCLGQDTPFYEPNIFRNIDQCIGCNEWSTGRYIIEWGDDDD